MRVSTFVMVALGALAMARPAGAAITFYMDRAAWEAAAAAAGLAVTTENFASAPTLSSFGVGGVTFAATGTAHNPVTQRLDRSGANRLMLDLTSLAVGTTVFGYGYDHVGRNAQVNGTGIDGSTGLLDSAVVGSGFVGMLGTFAFDPSNPHFDRPEIQVDDFPASLDNLSVATRSVPGGPGGPNSVPLPLGAAAGFALASGLGLTRRLRRR